MKLRLSIAPFALGLLLHPAAHAQAVQPAWTPECTPEQDKAPAIDIEPDEAAQHRRFQLPTVEYPFDTKLDGIWGQALRVRVDTQGHAVCYARFDLFDSGRPMHPQIVHALSGVPQWRYAPFIRDGKPVAAVVDERIDEQELPLHDLAMPTAPLDEITVTLQRTVCMGTCPAYAVQIHGDGHVAYVGWRYVETTGKREYRIPVPAIAQLVDDMRASNLWSLRDSYGADGSDLPSAAIEIRIGTQTHRIYDYMGTWVGMPRTVNDIEDEIDRVADTAQWIGKRK